MTAEPIVYNTAAPKFLTPKALAQRFMVAPMTIYRLIHDGAFPNAIRVGRSFRIPAADVHAFEENNRMDAGWDE